MVLMVDLISSRDADVERRQDCIVLRPIACLLWPDAAISGSVPERPLYDRRLGAAD